MGIKVGICGVGSFAEQFIPLFKLHPIVDNTILCDMNAELLRKRSDEFDIKDTCPSLIKLCESDVDAIAIFTQNWLHGPQAIQALKAGKHVYSAVPSAITMEEITDLVNTVKETRQIYMIGETSYYYPSTIYCRDRFKKGEFGDIVYGESSYYHDWDQGLYGVFKRRGGTKWKDTAGSPPMHYPTHSVSMIVSVTGAHMTHGLCLGYKDENKDGENLYGIGRNNWDNPFSNQTALFRMSDGSMTRVNEFRRIGCSYNDVRMSLYGTEHSFETISTAMLWNNKTWSPVDVTEYLKCINMDYNGNEIKDQRDKKCIYASRLHEIDRLPRSYVGILDTHQGSHQFLVDDFVKACHDKNLVPPNNVWDAARYLIPGIVAHQSSCNEGQYMEVPDFGDPPNEKTR